MPGRVSHHAYNVRISCIICAFNEASRIGAVLAVASVHPLLHEVIVVDDGSTDDTAEIVKRFTSVRLISYPVNRGKSFAVASAARIETPRESAY